jgi:hypothetical protein
VFRSVQGTESHDPVVVWEVQQQHVHHLMNTGGDFEAQSSGRDWTVGEEQTQPRSFLDMRNCGDDSGRYCTGHHPWGGGRSLVQGKVRLSQGVVLGDGGEGDWRNASRENITVY